ncbi:hypothetical protein PHLCEN_2v4039 [Hermanssonia centrifuga]|uniref:Protein kinase domain-containing protein n=1 Tax=Hermanssonia centrifuga TaxID=98765 RepID=A0A2R6Q5S9_9APHY|nr:hypothetical protein PHLCEN_2v4039 [Hermanssonia centrifuga]
MPFLGIDCDTFPVGEMPKCIVLPWAHFGSIRQCINRLEENSQSIPASRWVSEIAEGLAYLHGEGVMHGDLRGANVLINEEYGVQLSDFGLSDLVKTRTASVSRVFPEGVTSRWMAPELLQYDFVFPVESSSDLDQSGEARPTFAADVYAFACVCVEIYSGEDPQFPGIPAQGRGLSRAVEKAVKSGIRPLRPSTERRTMPDELWSIVETCWRQNATDRPSASEVVRTLKGLEASSQ